MNDAQRAMAKGIIAGVTLRKRSNLTKAYIALTFAAMYGIRAAREANRDLDQAVYDLKEERARPVVRTD